MEYYFLGIGYMDLKSEVNRQDFLLVNGYRHYLNVYPTFEYKDLSFRVYFLRTSYE